MRGEVRQGRRAHAQVEGVRVVVGRGRHAGPRQLVVRRCHAPVRRRAQAVVHGAGVSRLVVRIQHGGGGGGSLSQICATNTHSATAGTGGARGQLSHQRCETSLYTICTLLVHCLILGTSCPSSIHCDCHMHTVSTI